MRRSPQPFRGATLPPPLADVVEPLVEEHSASTVLRALVLSWVRLPLAERQHLLYQAASSDSAVAATVLLPPAPVDADATSSVPSFHAATLLTEDELFVAQHRLVEGPRLSLREVGALRGRTKAWAHKVEQRATRKLHAAVLRGVSQAP